MTTVTGSRSIETGARRPTVVATVLACALFGPLSAHATSGSTAGASAAATVVVAAPDDPYRPLAREIAAAEAARIVFDLEAAIRQQPEYVLWVAAPGSLSDAAMVAAGRLLGQAADPPSVGIITGSSLESARALWRRRGEARAETLVAIRGEYPAHGIEAPRLLVSEADATAPFRELAGRQVTPETVGAALGRADYVAFSGHGGGTYWRLTADSAFRAERVPPLAGVLATAGACQTLRPWVDGSIALAIVDRGAAAYAGFVYSPVAGYGFTGFPLRYTWPGFPVGHIVRLQNAAAGKGYAAFPFYFLLGDPRIALRDQRPYRLEGAGEGGRGDLREGPTYRVLGAPPGWLPLRIPGGAGFPAVRVRTPDGAILSWRTEPLHDARVQIGDVGADRLILVDQEGGDLEIELLRRTPAGPAAVKTAIGALDHVWIHLSAGSSGALLAVVGGVALAGLVVPVRRRGKGRRVAVPAVVVGLVLTAAHGAWALTRWDSIWIVSKPVVLLWPAILATALLGAAGTAAMLGLRPRWRRPVALLLAGLPALSGALFALAVVVGTPILFGPRIGASPYGFAFARPALLGALPIVLLVVVLLLIVERIQAADGAPESG